MGVGLAEFIREGEVAEGAVLDLVDGDDAFDAVGEEYLVGFEEIVEGKVALLGFVVGEDECAGDAATAAGFVRGGEEMGPSPPEDVAALGAGDEAVLVEEDDFGGWGDFRRLGVR